MRSSSVLSVTGARGKTGASREQRTTWKEGKNCVLQHLFSMLTLKEQEGGEGHSPVVLQAVPETYKDFFLICLMSSFGYIVLVTQVQRKKRSN